MCSINYCSSVRYFDEMAKTNNITIQTYLGRLILRTHQEDDTSSLASIYSDSVSRKYLPFLQPPNGWKNDDNQTENKRWTCQDFNDRVKVQNEARANGKSCVFNMILLASTSGEKHDRCIGTTGFVRIDGDIGYLGIITDKNTTRLGYATEALYTSIVFAFEKLGVCNIIMQTDERNQEMRGWCEKTAGLILTDKKPMEINNYQFTECEYKFNMEEWNSSIKNRLETKMSSFNKNKISSSKSIDE